MSVGVLALVAIMTIALLVMLGLWRLSVREAYIRETLLPPGLLDTLSSPFPALSLKDRQLVV